MNTQTVFVLQDEAGQLRAVLESDLRGVEIPSTVGQMALLVAKGEASFSDLLSEGGVGSGHFAHKGRHGLRGGSLPGAAHLTSPDKLTALVSGGGAEEFVGKHPKLGKSWLAASRGPEKIRIEKALHLAETNRLLKPHGVSVAGFVGAYSADYPGLKTEVRLSVETKIPGVATGVIVQAYFREKGGSDHVVASLERSINFSKKTVSHDSFFMDESYQGRGIAASVNRKSFDLYRKMGMKKVETYANGKVGGYAWALQGFDFVHHIPAYTADAMRVAVMAKLHDKSPGRADAIVDKLKHSWDYARVRVDGEKVGKSVLLGSRWSGTFDLAKGSASEKVFNRYLSETRKKLQKPKLTEDIAEGAPGSGHFGHKGRHGFLGGSLPGSSGLTLQEPDRVERQQGSKARGAELPTLTTGKIVSGEKLYGGVGNAYVVKFEDGSLACFKRPLDRSIYPAVPKGTDPQREVAAYEVAKLVGMKDLVPSTILRELSFEAYHAARGSGPRMEQINGLGSLQAWVKDASTAERHNENARYDGVQDRKRIAVFDFMIGNMDRHTGNWMVRDDKAGKLALIDNGAAFPVRNGETFSHRFILSRSPELTIRSADKIAWAGKWTKIEHSLQKLGIEKEAVSAMRDRYRVLMRKETKTLGQLDDFFTGKA